MVLKQIYCNSDSTCYSSPLEKRKVVKKSVSGVIVVGFVAIAGFLLFPDIRLKLLFLITVYSILVLLNIIFQCFYYRYYFYDLKEEEIIIKKGVISRNQIVLPYSKIQNIYIDQDFWDRIFKLYDVHVETAGAGSGINAHIDGLNEQNAKKINDILIAKTKKQNTDSSL